MRNGLTAANDEPTAEERRDTEGWYGNKKPIIKKGVQVYHYYNDHLGTPNELTDQQGEVVWYADYEAWGNTAKVEWHEQRIDNIVVSQENLQPIRFQGQSFDEETGLHYNRFRYFDPDMGMFTTRDPIGLNGGINVFQYAPNPVGWIDPFGLKCKKPSLFTKKGWKHIYERHIKKSKKWDHKSKFEGDTNRIKKRIEKTVKKGDATTQGQDFGRTKHTLDFNKQIGTRYNKQTEIFESQSQITVITDKSGKIVTAFPSNPG